MSKRSRKGSKKTASRHSAKHKESPDGKRSSEISISDRDFRIISLAILFLVAWIAYANALHNSLTFDDVTFSPGNRSWELTWEKVGQYFTSDVWAAAGKETGLYRPLFLLSVAAEISVFGEWLTGYHLVNVLLHSLVSLALFGLIRYLMLATGCSPRPAGYAALLSALIFAVHPINTEVVNSIFNRSDILVTLGVVAGLTWFLPRVKSSPLKAWTGFNLLFLLILFCKETAIMLPAIAVGCMVVDTPGDWRVRIRKCAPVITMILPICIFFVFRTIALSPDDATVLPDQAQAQIATEHTVNDVVSQQPDPGLTQKSDSKPILSRIGLNLDLGMLAPASKVWFDGLVKIVWPHPLLAFHDRSDSNFLLALAVQAGLLALSVIALIRYSPGPLLGLVIYYLAFLPSSRIFSQLAELPHLAERYLYLPSVGLAVALAFLLYWLLQKFPVKATAPFVLVAAIALTPVTWARNADWVSTVSLAQSDYDKGSRNRKNLEVLAAGLFRAGELDRARALCDRHAEAYPNSWYLNAICGQVYQQSGLEHRAERAYLRSLNHVQGKASGHYSLAIMYLGQGREAEAKEQFEQAIAAEQKAFMKEILAAEMLMQLYPKKHSKLLEAKFHLERAVELQPQVLYAQQRMAEVNKMLRTANDD